PGVTQTASVKSPYIYAEDNWVDDMELAYAAVAWLENGVQPPAKKGTGYLTKALAYAAQEPVTPWMKNDTANHYQWYPFVNIGHYELGKQLKGEQQKQITGYYQQGIEAVWGRAKQNAFFRGIPFIWCSNNLTASFAIQCYWYAQLTGS